MDKRYNFLTFVDMVTVEQLIGNLLLRHNCVIIPSFGGFVAKPISARIDYEKGTMLPPGKSLLFNRQLINNDGLLVSEYAHSNHVSFDEAQLEVTSLVKSWGMTLQSGGRIEIDNVGNLFFDEESNICFEQDRFCNLLLESFGLGTVHFLSEEDVQIVEKRISPVVTEAAQDTVETAKERKVAEPTIVAIKTREEKKETPIIPIEKSKQPTVAEEPQKKRKAWRYVAAACILPIAFYSVWIPVKTDVLESGVISYRDFNPFKQATEGSYEAHELDKNWASEKGIRGTLDKEIAELEGNAEIYPFKFSDDTYIKVQLPENNETSATQVEAQEIPAEVVGVSANRMDYIVGCFGEKENAENLVAKLRANGLDAKIIDIKNGLHRVTAGSSISEEAYQTIKLKSDSLGFSGWRLH